jgi:hypothetical protein
MQISEAEVRDLLRIAVGRAAQSVGISAPFTMEDSAVIGEIRPRDRGLSDALETFLGAYAAWFGFHARVEGEGRQGQLTSDEHGELVRLIDSRDRSRRQLLSNIERAEATRSV